MDRKQSDKNIGLTESERQILHEMINAYQNMKIVSRCMKWGVFVLIFINY